MARKIPADAKRFDQMFAAKDFPMVMSRDGRTHTPYVMGTYGPEPITDQWSFRINEDGTVTYSGDVPAVVQHVFA